jgi:ABC-type uncharacterized transport system permease subunit
MLPINRHPAASELAKFSRIYLPAFVVLFGALLWWRSESMTPALITWAVGGIAAAGALASAEVARLLFVGLQTVTYPLGLIVSTVVLAFLFFVVFTPIGLVMRAIGRDPLRLRARQASTHWLPYRQNDDPKHAFRQF